MTRDELATINELVFARFPKLPKERTCKTEKSFRDAARESYRNRLINDLQSKKIILPGVAPSAENI